jgi:hypothetical protein
MTDAVGSASSPVEIPAELMGKIALSLGAPNNYVIVRGAVERFNKATGSTIDPITVAEVFVKKGFNIISIPERKVAIQPTPEGLVLDVKQILQILIEDRLAEFPILSRAIDIVQYMSIVSRGNLRGAMEAIGKTLSRSSFTDDDENKDPLVVAEGFLLRQATSNIRYGHETVPREEVERAAPRVVEQVKYLLDNFESEEQLRTKEERYRHEHQHEIAKEEDRRARESRREELFASSEAAERWLFGVARGAYRDAKENLETAAQDLSESKRARELIAHHSINIFDFANRQIEGVGDERDRRRELWRIEAPLSVLLSAFTKPRTTTSSPQEIRKDPGGHMYRLLTLWLDAKFVRELPDGAYTDVLRNEREYQERYRNRTDDYMRRDSLFGYGREADSFLEQMASEEKARGDREMRGYESSRVAALWWKCPLWLQWKILRPYIGEELRNVGALVRGFSGKQFLAHIDDLIAKENRLIQLQNALLGTSETQDKDALERYWKEIVETGQPSSATRLAARTAAEGTPTQERAEAIIKECRDRIRNLEEMRGYVNLDFVMSRTEREAEIERQQRERDRWRIPRFRW